LDSASTRWRLLRYWTTGGARRLTVLMTGLLTRRRSSSDEYSVAMEGAQNAVIRAVGPQRDRENIG
jgi:hypothetical protein